MAILSGRRHRVYGGVALHLLNGQLRYRLVRSYVCFRRLSTLDIDQYIDSGDWRGKAGGYAIQGMAARFIRDISGSYSNIVGFSIYDVTAMLDAAGWYQAGIMWASLEKTNPSRTHPTIMTSAVRLFHEKAPGQDRLGFLGPDDQLLEIWFDALHRPNLMGDVHQARIDRVFSSQNRAMASLKNGEVISVRLRKNDWRLVFVGAILPVTIIAAPRHGKPWQALVGARLVTDKMVLLAGEVDKESAVQLSSKISGNQRQQLTERLMAEIRPVLPLGYGIILRRNGVDLSDFGAAATALLKMWQAGTKTLAKDRLGLIFDAGDLLTRARRMVGNLPVINNLVLGHDLSMTLDDVIAEARLAKCQLACGGHLWCEQTQCAIWSIDLDGNGVQWFRQTMS